MKIVVIALLAAAPLPTPAVANRVDNSAVTAKYERTVAYFRAATARDSIDQVAWYNLAMAYRYLGRTPEAHRALHRVLDLQNTVLETGSGDEEWSHALARRALYADVASAR